MNTEHALRDVLQAAADNGGSLASDLWEHANDLLIEAERRGLIRWAQGSWSDTDWWHITDAGRAYLAGAPLPPVQPKPPSLVRRLLAAFNRQPAS